MPFYTFISSYQSRTAIYQSRGSNPKGMIGRAVASSFPQLAKNYDALGILIRQESQPIPNLAHTWRFASNILNSDFLMHIVETRS